MSDTQLAMDIRIGGCVKLTTHVRRGMDIDVGLQIDFTAELEQSRVGKPQPFQIVN